MAPVNISDINWIRGHVYYPRTAELFSAHVIAKIRIVNINIIHSENIEVVKQHRAIVVENQAIIPLEGAIGTLEGIESIDSYADHRSGMIFITYNDDTNTKFAYLKLQQKIESVKGNLSDEFNIIVLKVDTEQISNQFMDLEVRGSGGVDRIRKIVDENIIEKLESVDGIASVEVFGGREKSIEIILNNA